MSDIDINRQSLERALDTILTAKPGWLPKIGACYHITLDAEEWTIVSEVVGDACHHLAAREAAEANLRKLSEGGAN